MRSEHDFQVACITWFRLKHRKHIIYAIPNGGQRNIIVAKKLKAEGVLAGIPDLHIPVASNGYNSLYVELKLKGNKPSTKQLSMIKRLEGANNKCVVCYSLDEFMSEVDNYLKPA